MKRKIDFNTFYSSDNYTKNLQDLLSDYQLFQRKHYSQLCLDHLSKHYPNANLFLTHSATGALEMIALLLDIKAGDEIILPSYTFVSTANAFARQGAKLVFVDIEKDTLGINPILVEKAITNKTKAVVCMHYAGHSCQIAALKNITQQNNLFLIEDAALCYGNFELGVQGDFGVVSFDVTKHISATQGGLLLVNNQAFAERAQNIYHIGTNREAFNEGNVPYYEWVDIGSKFQMAETNAAILATQLQDEQKILSLLFQVNDRYVENFTQINEVETMPSSPNNLHEYYILTKNIVERNALSKFLKEKGISSLFHYIPLHNSKYARDNELEMKGNISQKIADRLLRLPFHTKLSNDDIDYICMNIKKYFVQ